MLKSKIQLRPYQQKIVSGIIGNDHREGFLVMGTGAGKTIVSIELIARLGLTTTIICHTTAIGEQWKTEIEKYLGIKPSIIDAKNKDIGQITIATVQSLYSNKDLCKKLAEKTSILFTDEGHLFISPNRMSVLDTFKPKYRFALSGSPFRDRDDGRTDALFFIHGEKICEFYLEQLKPMVKVIKTNEKIPVDDYHAIVDKLVENTNRNTLINGISVGEMMSGKRILILCKRRAHCRLLYDKYPKEWQNNAVFLIDSADKDRNTLLGQFKRNEKPFSILIGTTSLLSTGIDIPSLDVLMLVADMKSEVLCTQSAGRILRLFEGKKDPLIYDIADNWNPILWRQFQVRHRFYKDKGWTITGLDK